MIFVSYLTFICILGNGVLAEIGFDKYFSNTIEKAGTTSAVCTNTEELAADSKSGYDVQYSIQSQDPDGGFTVGETDGFLQCDFSKIQTNGQSYTVVVRLYTEEPGEQEDVSLTVTFPNVQPPSVSFTSPTNSQIFNIDETTSAGVTLTTLSATSSGGSVTYSILNSQNNHFTIDGSTLKTSPSVTSSTFDLEASGAVTSFSLTLKASDGTYSDEVTISVEIDDMDDNDPVFSQSSYSFSVAENATGGDVVGSVTATDADVTNNVISYTITGTSVFTIDSSTGQLRISTGQSLNHSVTPSYTFTVTAEDSASVPSNTDVQVVVNVNTDTSSATTTVANTTSKSSISSTTVIVLATVIPVACAALIATAVAFYHFKGNRRRKIHRSGKDG